MRLRLAAGLPESLRLVVASVRDVAQFDLALRKGQLLRDDTLDRALAGRREQASLHRTLRGVVVAVLLGLVLGDRGDRQEGAGLDTGEGAGDVVADAQPAS